MSKPAQVTHTYVGAFVEELARSGLRHVCIAPGSRSTPLALMLAAHPGIRIWMHLDERSASFFALGMARASGEPVALVCTSGTAAANFFPAVVEARSSGVPLVVLTADRPPELRDVGAPQTIDQSHLYGSYSKWFVEVAISDGSAELLRYIRTLACRSVATAVAAPRGPVHLNFPFREPLVPQSATMPDGMSVADALAWNGRPRGEPWVAVADANRMASSATIERIAIALASAARPLIVCGPQFDEMLPAALGKLAAVLRAPLLADPLSQARWGPHDRTTICDRYDSILRDESVAIELVPDVILRLGAVPTSKTLLQFMQSCDGATQILVDANGWPDPALVATDVVQVDPSPFCAALLVRLLGSELGGEPGWMDRWRRIDTAATDTLESYLSSLDEPFEGAALAQVASRVPSGATLYMSSSMPVRDLDAFAHGDARVVTVLANRGANGIDGVISSALGAAATTSHDGPLVLVIGDIAFYHDMNGLLAAKLHALDATIVVLNNDGGGIFSFLPQATQAADFEKLFGTPHGLTFESVAALYGARYQLAKTTQALGVAVSECIGGTGLAIIEMRTDRTRNVALHRNAWSAVADALSEHGNPAQRAR